MKKLFALIIFACTLPAWGQGWTIGGGNVLAGGNHLVRICPQTDIATYIATVQVCEQPPAMLIWKSYTCTSVPTSICTNLGVNGANINFLLDPNGGHTLLFQATGGVNELWNVTAGQSVHVTITGKIWGATLNDTWPHFDDTNSKVGQTGDGTEENIVAVGCGSNCLADGRIGKSDIPCNSLVAAGIECINQLTDVYIIPYGAQFTAATPQAPYSLTIDLMMSGGSTGTATIKSMGIHLL